MRVVLYRFTGCTVRVELQWLSRVIESTGTIRHLRALFQRLVDWAGLIIPVLSPADLVPRLGRANGGRGRGRASRGSGQVDSIIHHPASTVVRSFCAKFLSCDQGSQSLLRQSPTQWITQDEAKATDMNGTAKWRNYPIYHMKLLLTSDS